MLLLGRRLVPTFSRRVWAHYSTTQERVNVDFNLKPYYVTTPIFYPNAAPHIGHLYSLVVADVFARHARLTSPASRPVEFITGLDEHGLKIQKAAAGQNVTPLELCNNQAKVFEKLCTEAHISHTRFVRTTSEGHKKGVVHLWNRLLEKGLIYKGNHNGWYSVTDECFYPDSQVTCVKTTDPFNDSEVTTWVSTETGSKVEWTEEENYKLSLAPYRERLLEYYTSNPSSIHPPSQHALVLQMLSSPLPDLSISRPASRLSWGIPVPNDPSHTIYVWLDALTIYLSSVGYPWVSPAFQDRWPPNLQIIGKDILKFHAIYLPSILLALSLPLPSTILSHAHWTSQHQKMSKSIGNTVNPFFEIAKYTPEIVRWYLLRHTGTGGPNSSFAEDSDWSDEQLRKHRLELVSLGNLLLRIQSHSVMGAMPIMFKDVPLLREILLDREKWMICEDGVGRESEVDVRWRTELSSLSTSVDALIREHRIGEALERILSVLDLANTSISNHRPWHTSTSQSILVPLITLARETLRICSILLQPFIPAKATQLLSALRVNKDKRLWVDAKVGAGDQRPGMMRRDIVFPSGRKEKTIEGGSGSEKVGHPSAISEER